MLTKPRVPAQTSGNAVTTRKKRRLSPLMLVGMCVPVILALVGVSVFVVLPLTGSHAAATPNPNCTLIVPPNPLTAQGLATPYQLTATDPANGPCNEANVNQSAFVQADILNPTTGQITTYDPLVIDKGTQPAVQPVAPQLPRNAVVATWFGDNGTTLTLLKTNAMQHGRGGRGGSYGFGGAPRFRGQHFLPGQQFHFGFSGGANGNCVNGLPGSPFGQFAYCNAPAFFQVANFLIAAHKITVPPLGTATDGLPCPTTRDFSIVDMDQSDNVQTQYLANANGQTAQFSAANQAEIQNATTISNPSDNALLSRFVDPALGCKPWQVSDIVNNNTPTATYGTDELQAAREQGAPVALVPAGDEMVLVNNNPSLQKVNLYRAGADQPFATTLNNAGRNTASTTTYCQNLINVALPRLQRDMTTFQNQPSPDGGATATTLFGFLANRLNATISANGLNCVGLLNIQNPVTLTTDGNGVVTAATLATTPVAVTATTTTTTGTTTTTPATPTPLGGGSVRIASGGSGAGLFVADEDFSNITPGRPSRPAKHTSSVIDTSGVSNPAPQSVYQSARVGDCLYTISHLAPNASYTVRLHFAEIFWTRPGIRTFNVTLNGQVVLSNFDILATAGAANKAVVKQFVVHSDSTGTITIQFKTVKDNALINAIEVLAA